MIGTEWFDGRGTDEQPARKTVAPYWAVAAAILLGGTLAGALWAGKVYAEPRLLASNGQVTVTLYDEPCELKEHVSNLPFKATWQEGGRTFKGCWASHPDMELVAAYFDDLTVAVIPFGALKRVQGA